MQLKQLISDSVSRDASTRTSRLLCFLLAAGAGSAAFAQGVGGVLQQSCEQRLAPAQVRFRTEPSQIQYDFAHSVAQLTAKNSKSAAGGSRGGAQSTLRTLGLTVATRTVRFAWSFSALTSSAGGCLRPSVDIFVTVSPQTVYIAREFPQGSCAFKEIAEHELRHVYANQESLEAVSAHYQALITRVLGQTIYYGDPAQLKAQFETTFSQQWQPQILASLRQVDQVHERIDSPEEYARNNVVCGGEIPARLSASR